MMTTELFCLTLTALLAASLWIPYIIGVNITSFEGQEESFSRPPDHRKMLPWVHRSYRAHQNLLEQFTPFAVIVLIGHSLKVSNALTSWLAIAFLILRIVHAAGMISGHLKFPLRPIVFTTGWLVVLIYAWQVLAYAR
jgi:uncharacterized MAPEG superfamily protein